MQSDELRKPYGLIIIKVYNKTILFHIKIIIKSKTIEFICFYNTDLPTIDTNENENQLLQPIIIITA